MRWHFGALMECSVILGGDEVVHGGVDAGFKGVTALPLKMLEMIYVNSTTYKNCKM